MEHLRFMRFAFAASALALAAVVGRGEEEGYVPIAYEPIPPLFEIPGTGWVERGDDGWSWVLPPDINGMPFPEYNEYGDPDGFFPKDDPLLEGIWNALSEVCYNLDSMMIMADTLTSATNGLDKIQKILEDYETVKDHAEAAYEHTSAPHEHGGGGGCSGEEVEILVGSASMTPGEWNNGQISGPKSTGCAAALSALANSVNGIVGLLVGAQSTSMDVVSAVTADDGKVSITGKTLTWSQGLLTQVADKTFEDAEVCTCDDDNDDDNDGDDDGDGCGCGWEGYDPEDYLTEADMEAIYEKQEDANSEHSRLDERIDRLDTRVTKLEATVESIETSIDVLMDWYTANQGYLKIMVDRLREDRSWDPSAF